MRWEGEVWSGLVWKGGVTMIARCRKESNLGKNRSASLFAVSEYFQYGIVVLPYCVVHLSYGYFPIRYVFVDHLV